MTSPRFSIGIDLGTTNSALAFVPLDGETKSEILAIPQWQTLSGMTEDLALPSFLYLPEEAAAIQIKSGPYHGGRLDCRPARTKKGWRSARPGRPFREVLAVPPYLRSHSALSALGIGRHRPYEQDLTVTRLGDSYSATSGERGTAGSPMRGPDFDFDSQDITVTVPASFDAAAQRLTLMAAQEAGFPETVRLLEEPQAAFYSWLEQHDFAADLVNKLPNDNGIRHVLVVDIGGGTSDFSLFALRSQARSSVPGNQARGGWRSYPIGRRQCRSRDRTAPRTAADR